jgi:hypothetical protein
MEPAPRDGRHGSLGRSLAIGASLAALASAAAGLHIAIPALADARRYWSALPASLRDDPVAEIYGFGDATWESIGRLVRPGDRVAIVAEGDAQYDIRNYASYRLLPAIVVLDAASADVVVYHKVDPPAGPCEPVGKGVCVVLHRR